MAARNTRRGRDDLGTITLVVSVLRGGLEEERKDRTNQLLEHRRKGDSGSVEVQACVN